MAKEKKKNKKNDKYNADNEIIIGVTTKAEEKKAKKEKKQKEKVKKEKTPKRKNQKYNADNEIIIGVNTKAKDKKEEKAKKEKSKKQKALEKNKKKIIEKNKKKYNFNNASKEKIIKKRNRKIKLVSTIIIILIAIGGTIYYLTTPTFNIASINVFGFENNSEETYISLSGIVLDETNIFQVTRGSIRKNLKENAYVEDVTIKRKLPNTLEIYVEERKPEYQIKYNDSYMYINNQGYILEINEERKDIIEIIGFITPKSDVRPGERLDTHDLVKLDTILKIVNSYKFSNIEEKITSIDATTSSDYILNLGEIGKEVHLGDASHPSERMLWIKTILPREEGNEGTIFINGDLSKDKVYFKEKE